MFRAAPLVVCAERIRKLEPCFDAGVPRDSVTREIGMHGIRVSESQTTAYKAEAWAETES